MDENYDEFGNYIGPEIPEINDDEDEEQNNNFQNEENSNSNSDMDEENSDSKTEKNLNNLQSLMEEEINTDSKNNNYNVILDEDKKEFPEADEIYPNVENLVMEEDTQPITQPLITPKHKNKLDLFETELPELTFDFNFMGHLMTLPKLKRNIAIAGSLQHGKTTLMDV